MRAEAPSTITTSVHARPAVACQVVRRRCAQEFATVSHAPSYGMRTLCRCMVRDARRVTRMHICARAMPPEWGRRRRHVQAFIGAMRGRCGTP